MGVVKASPVKLITQSVANGFVKGLAEAGRDGNGIKIKEYPPDYTTPVINVPPGQKAQLVLSVGVRLSLKNGQK